MRPRRAEDESTERTSLGEEAEAATKRLRNLQSPELPNMSSPPATVRGTPLQVPLPKSASSKPASPAMAHLEAATRAIPGLLVKVNLRVSDSIKSALYPTATAT